MSKAKPKAAPAATTQDTEPSFEDALTRVESIIERIETGQIGLEESLTEYERGVHLINLCRARLDQAQQRVEDLTKKLETVDTDEPLSTPSDEEDDHT